MLWLCCCFLQSFWSRLAGKYGNKFYWQEKGEAASIMSAVSALAARLAVSCDAMICRHSLSSGIAYRIVNRYDTSGVRSTAVDGHQDDNRLALSRSLLLLLLSVRL
jgi:hypothetical protein